MTDRVRVEANGITQHVHVRGPEDGRPLLLIHGNCSSGAFWSPFVRRLPDDWRVVAPDLRGYGESETAPVDATRGLRDFADDVAALLDARLFPAGTRPLVAAHSMGCGVAMHLLVDHPGRMAGLLLESPVSPYGFGGTRDVDGTPTTDGLRRHRRRRGQPVVRRAPAGRGPLRRRPGQPAPGDAHDVRGRPRVVRRRRGGHARHAPVDGGRAGQLPGRRDGERELAGDRPGPTRGAQRAVPTLVLGRRRPGRRGREAADRVGAGHRGRRSSPTPPCSTWPTSASSGRCRAGRATVRAHPSP